MWLLIAERLSPYSFGAGALAIKAFAVTLKINFKALPVSRNIS
jgi:hypothetical protein